MMMFLFFSLGMVTTTMGSFTGAFRLEIALAFGMTITVLVFIFGPISGANMNPAVSFGLMISKNISPIRMGLYWLAQLIGGIVGMACARALNADAYDTDNGSGKYNVGYGTVNYVRGLEGDSGAFLGEFLCTMFLMLTVMAAVENGTDERAHHTGSLAPFCIGLAVFLAHLVLIPYTGCSINPARSFAASVINGEFTDHWLFWIAPLMGSGVGVVVYEIIWKKREDESL
jgi:MIP family channel proteins